MEKSLPRLLTRLSLGLGLACLACAPLRADLRFFWLDRPSGRNNPHDPRNPHWQAPTAQPTAPWWASATASPSATLTPPASATPLASLTQTPAATATLTLAASPTVAGTTATST